MMTPMHHSTPGAAGGPCWTCTAFVRMVYAGSAARCGIDGGHRVQAHPASGCAFFQREPGTDDEDGPPAGQAEQAMLKPAVVQAPPVAWVP